jgi:hypothetical protein
VELLFLQKVRIGAGKMNKRNENLKEQALKIIDASEKKGIPLRLLGGMAVYLTSPCTQQALYSREIADLDFVVTKKKAYPLEKLLATLGFEGDREFNSIHGESRLLFYSELGDLDIFVGDFAQCHKMALEKLLSSTRLTIPLANLLLTKLQVVQINQKDILDILALLHDHDLIPEGDPNDVINLAEFNAILADDWGWYTTCTDSLEKVQQYVGKNFKDPDQKLLNDKIDLLRSSAANAKKSLKWTVRSKVGRKVQWYELPEEK